MVAIDIRDSASLLASPAGQTILPLPARCDALPEHLEYRDEGCELAPRCLECPLPRCKHDEPGGARHLKVETRDGEIARVWLASGGRIRVNELAQRYGLSRRSVFRILRAIKSRAPEAKNTRVRARGQRGRCAVGRGRPRPGRLVT